MSAHIDPEALGELLDGALGPREQSAARDHLEVCPDCSQLLSSLESAAGLVGSLPVLELSELEHQRLVRASLEWRESQAAEAAPGLGAVGGKTVEQAPEYANMARKRPAARRWMAAGLAAAVIAGFAVVSAIRRPEPVPGSPVVEAEGPPLLLASGRDVRRVVGSLPQVKNQVGKYSLSAVGRESRSTGGSEPGAAAPETSGVQDSDANAKSLGGRAQPAPAGVSAAPTPATAAASTPAPAPAAGGQFSLPASSPAAEPAFSYGDGRSCLDKVLDAQPYALAPLLARKAQFQGRAAWALVYAWTPSKDPSAKLDRVQVWILSAEDCKALTGTALINRVISYSSFAP